MALSGWRVIWTEPNFRNWTGQGCVAPQLRTRTKMLFVIHCVRWQAEGRACRRFGTSKGPPYDRATLMSWSDLIEASLVIEPFPEECNRYFMDLVDTDREGLRFVTRFEIVIRIADPHETGSYTGLLKRSQHLLRLMERNELIAVTVDQKHRRHFMGDITDGARTPKASRIGFWRDSDHFDDSSQAAPSVFFADVGEVGGTVI